MFHDASLFCTVCLLLCVHVFVLFFPIYVQFYRHCRRVEIQLQLINISPILHQHIYQPVEVLGSSYCNKAIWIRQLGKHPNFVIIFKLYTNRHNEYSKN